MELEITLALSIVDQEADEYHDYPYDYIKPRAAEIIIRSLYGFDVLGLRINENRDVVVHARTTRKLEDFIVGVSTTREYLVFKYDPEASLEKQRKWIAMYLEDNYGDAGPDTWMEGDISFPYNGTYDKYELFLDLVDVKFLG